MTKTQKSLLWGIYGFISLSFVQLVLTLNVWATDPTLKSLPISEPLNVFRDIVIPLANMGIGAIIAILLIWTIYPVINRNTETLREIATTLNVMSSNNLTLSQKLLDIIERQTFMIRDHGDKR